MRFGAATATLALTLTTCSASGPQPPAGVVVATMAPAAPAVDRMRIGAYIHRDGRPFQPAVDPADLAVAEAELGQRFDIVHYFFPWGAAFAEGTPNTAARDLLLSMKPDGDLVARIGAGEQDGYLARLAADARAHGRPVYLRFGHEMNGEWMSYSAGHPGGPSAEAFKQAWIRLVRVVRAEGATNVRFVWCPNERDHPAVPGNRMEDYWPGDDWVDVAGFDAFNWSNRLPARGDGQWRGFEQVVEGPYERVAALTVRPIWLCEFGTTEPQIPPDPPRASKGRWFRDMFASTRFPRLEALVYFSEKDDRDTQRDWRLETSAESLAGFREGWATRHGGR